jgi:DAK2 domain fusion protein YloV
MDLVRLDATTAGGAELRSALLASSEWLDGHAARIDALNVFPVPDGDTGTNMSLTLRAAADALREASERASVSEVAKTAYRAALLGARGNSGVILSQLLRGFSVALDGKEHMANADLAAALTEASQVAYGSISQPVEGTILTVARVAAEAAAAAAHLDADLPTLLGHAVRAATAAVEETPNQLEALRKAGVVDSGGEGYRVILEGAWLWSTGRHLVPPPPAAPHRRALLDAVAADETPFGFCTEVLVRDSTASLDDVRATIESEGGSVLVVGDADLLRIHVHTLHPGRVIDYAVDRGTVVKVKVENMTLQNQEMAAHSDGTPVESASTIGVIAVAAGDGLQNVFRSLGATVVEGGQSMNPSVQEILTAANRSGYQELILLPNNPNIILTARSAQTVTPHRIEVVPTRSVPEGISALLAYNFQADLETNMAAMVQAARGVHTVEVTRSVRDGEVDGIEVHTGDVLGIYDGRLLLTDASAERALQRVLEQTTTESLEIVTVYFGADATAIQADAVATALRDIHPGLAVEVVDGGQAYYPYIASLE